MALRPNMVSKYYHGKQYKRLFMIMPRSLVTIPVIIVLALVLSAEFGSLGQEQGTSAGFMVWAMILFMLRDFCFIYLWSLFAQGNEKETTVVPVLIALSTYTIVPVLLYHFDLRILPVLYALFPRKQLSHLQRKRFSDGYPAGAGICLYAGSSDFGHQKEIPRTPGLSSRQKNPRFRRGFFIAKISYCF